MASAEERRAAIASFRVSTVRLALRVSWLLLAAVLIVAVHRDALPDLRVWASLAAGAAGTVGLALINWRDALVHRRSVLMLTLWGALTVVTTAVLSTVSTMVDVALLLAFAIVVFSAVLAAPRGHAVLTLGAAAAYLLAPLSYGTTRSLSELLLPIVALLIVALVAGQIAAQLRREAIERLRQAEELHRREISFERLYEVTKTMTSGSSLEGVLPELVGRIGRYLRAQVGLVVLHDPDRSALKVMSPIWTVGYALEIQGYSLPATGTGEIERVFQTGFPALYRELDLGTRSILSELGARTAMCVPLRVEGRTIGVLVLADKEDGTFDDEDLEALTSLSGPAALVLAQLERIEQAAETSRRMEELARMKTDFVSVVSHELRTPLTSIIGSLATLSRPELAPEGSQARELLASARLQADRLRRLIENLLMISRIEHGSLPQNPKKIELGQFLENVVAAIPADDRSVTVDVLPGAESLSADPDHLNRIVINLVDNALKYAPSSPVEVVAEPDGPQIRISVIDHGSGIALSHRDRAFERFAQLEPAQTRSQGGAGLGLSIVRGLARSMGGHLELRDTPGGGATFIVTIPRRPGVSEPQAAALSTSR
jgi:signal transduction histidine kinase